MGMMLGDEPEKTCSRERGGKPHFPAEGGKNARSPETPSWREARRKKRPSVQKGERSEEKRKKKSAPD